jgi:hypothetical protein
MRDFAPAYDRCGSKLRKTRSEHMFSVLPPIADMAARFISPRP